MFEYKRRAALLDKRPTVCKVCSSLSSSFVFISKIEEKLRRYHDKSYLIAIKYIFLIILARIFTRLKFIMFRVGETILRADYIFFQFIEM